MNVLNGHFVNLIKIFILDRSKTITSIERNMESIIKQNVSHPNITTIINMSKTKEFNFQHVSLSAIYHILTEMIKSAALSSW